MSTPRPWRRRFAIASLLFAVASAASAPARADDDLFWLKPTIQIGGHAETGAGVMPGTGLDPRAQGGGVAFAFSLMAPTRPRLQTGFAFAASAGHAAIAPQTPVGEQTYSIASARAMARLEYWSDPPYERSRHGSGLYALLGAGWTYNAEGTQITYLAGAPTGTAEDIHLGNSPSFEVGGGLALAHKPDGFLVAEVTWVYNRGPYRLEVSGEPDVHGTYDLSGFTFLLGLRLNPRRNSDER